MSETRDLQADKAFVASLDGIGTSYLVETIADHAIDRAIAAEKEVEKWKREALQQYPTPDAYDAACAALEKHRQRADAAEKERDELLQYLKSEATSLQTRIDKRQGENYHDESRTILVLEERLGVYESIIARIEGSNES